MTNRIVDKRATVIRMGKRVDVDALVGATEIAARLGLAFGESVHSWRRRYPDFPQPVATVSGVLIWNWPEVEAWARKTGRTTE